MGLLDNLVGQALGKMGGDQQHQLLQAAASLITQHGGLEGLQQRFAGANLGHIFSSWIGTGQNQPVTGEHIAQVFGQEKLQEIAQQTGLSHEHTASGLAALLPNLIDKLTPGGQSVGGPALQQGLAGLLQSGLGAIFK